MVNIEGEDVFDLTIRKKVCFCQIVWYFLAKAFLFNPFSWCY